MWLCFFYLCDQDDLSFFCFDISPYSVILTPQWLPPRTQVPQGLIRLAAGSLKFWMSGKVCITLPVLRSSIWHYLMVQIFFWLLAEERGALTLESFQLKKFFLSNVLVLHNNKLAKKNIFQWKQIFKILPFSLTRREQLVYCRDILTFWLSNGHSNGIIVSQLVKCFDLLKCLCVTLSGQEGCRVCTSSLRPPGCGDNLQTGPLSSPSTWGIIVIVKP